jgi:hypothetical protein
LPLNLPGKLKLRVCPVALLPTFGDGARNGVRQRCLEELQIERGTEIEQSRKVRCMTGRPYQDAAVLENRALSAALSTANNLETSMVHDVVGVTAKKTEEVLGRGSGFS